MLLYGLASVFVFVACCNLETLGLTQRRRALSLAFVPQMSFERCVHHTVKPCCQLPCLLFRRVTMVSLYTSAHVVAIVLCVDGMLSLCGEPAGRRTPMLDFGSQRLCGFVRVSTDSLGACAGVAPLRCPLGPSRLPPRGFVSVPFPSNALRAWELSAVVGRSSRSWVK